MLGVLRGKLDVIRGLLGLIRAILGVVRGMLCVLGVIATAYYSHTYESWLVRGSIALYENIL